jgi:hypothetical protein
LDITKQRTRRYSIESKDDMGRSVWFATADWTDEERRVAIAQNSRLCGLPDENCFTEAPKKPPGKHSAIEKER